MAKYRAGFAFKGYVVPAGGGTVWFTDDWTKLTPSEEVDLHDGTAGNDANKVFVAGVKGASAKLEIWDNDGSAGTVYEATFEVGSRGTIVWGRQGTVVGKPKRGFEYIVKGFNNPLSHNELSKFEVDLQFTGAPVFGKTSTW